MKSITERAGIMFGVTVLGLGVLVLVGMLLMTDRPAPDSLINIIVAVVGGLLGYATRGVTDNK